MPLYSQPEWHVRIAELTRSRRVCLWTRLLSSGSAGSRRRQPRVGWLLAENRSIRPAVALSVTLSVYGQMSNQWWSQGG
jgi:hypothetical protein